MSEESDLEKAHAQLVEQRRLGDILRHDLARARGCPSMRGSAHRFEMIPDAGGSTRGSSRHPHSVRVQWSFSYF
jgi:hypothetical protein